MTGTVVTASVLEISFTGDHPMYENSADHDGWGVGTAINDPVWTSAGVNKPACYTNGSAVSMTVKLDVIPDLPAGKSCEATLLADGPGDLDGTTSVTLCGSSVTANLTTTGTLSNMVYKATPTFEWKLVCGGATSLIGSSSHTIYVTYGRPYPGGDLTEKRIARCVADAIGATTKIQAADGIYPVRGAQFNGATDTTPLNFSDAPPSEVNHWFMFSPDEPGWAIRGSCAAFAMLNKKMLDLLGATGGTVVYIYASTDCVGIEQTT